ncbi:hypothetical protein C4577_07410 [Candidatus Parcubacteria bacterium]|nr:MAG: hypothetical protein C4577_07410 [Candidatus Parcubacteria bacterium]
MATAREIEQLIEIAIENKRYEDDNPEVGADFFQEDRLVENARLELHVMITKEQREYAKQQLQNAPKRLMSPPAGFDRYRG